VSYLCNCSRMYNASSPSETLSARVQASEFNGREAEDAGSGNVCFVRIISTTSQLIIVGMECEKQRVCRTFGIARAYMLRAICASTMPLSARSQARSSTDAELSMRVQRMSLSSERSGLTFRVIIAEDDLDKARYVPSSSV
jgi:hypothetical protein